MKKQGVISTAINKAENGVGEEGARSLGEALKVNTALTSLNLKSAQQQKDHGKQGTKSTSIN